MERQANQLLVKKQNKKKQGKWLQFFQKHVKPLNVRPIVCGLHTVIKGLRKVYTVTLIVNYTATSFKNMSQPVISLKMLNSSHLFTNS